MGDETGAEHVAATLPVEPMDWTPDTLLELSARHPDAQLRGAAGTLQHVIDVNSRFSPEEVLREAGFRSVDFGTDVQMLTGEGIRLRSARFDPARASSTNIRHSILPGG